jgi:uncharacterized protein YbjT (DUF2867 family)
MTEIRRIYRVDTNDPEGINRVLADLADRLDQLEGYRGKGRFLLIPSADQGATGSTDLARYGDVITFSTAAASSAASAAVAAIVTISVNTVEVYAQDDPDTILHGMGDV